MAEIPPPPAYVNPPEYPQASSSTIRYEDYDDSDSEVDPLLPISSDTKPHSKPDIAPAPPPPHIVPLSNTGSTLDFQSLRSCAISDSVTAAAINGQDDVLSLYFREGVAVDTYTCLGTTALFIAVCMGNTRLARFLLSLGASPSRWSVQWNATQQHGHWHGLRDFFLNVREDERDIGSRVIRYEEEKRPGLDSSWPYSMFISEAHSSIEALFVSRTPLMQAASKGNLVLVKAMVEQYHADPLMVAPDGQNAFRLARDNGHYAVAEYLPSTNAGGIRRIKFRSRHLVRQIRVISRGLGSYLKVLLYDFPKFLLWTVPKETGLFIGRTLGDAEKMGRFLRFVFWTTPKFILWDIPKTFPDIAKWFWEVLTVHLPPFLYRSAIGFWNLLLMAGITIGHAIVGLVSTIHTAIMAVITFLRSASLQDIWNGFVTVLHALFVSLPVLVWDGLKAAVRGIDSFMCNIFGILWLFGQMLIAGIMFIPIILWNSLGEVGIWLGKVGREALLFINPNW